LLSGVKVVNRGHRDRGSLDFAVGRGELLDRTKTAAAKFARYRVRPRCIRVDDPDQPYGHAFLGKLVINASVIAAKRAHANYGDVNEVVSGQFSVLSRQVAGTPVDLITKAGQINLQLKKN
jgi:hypothetical protein